MKVICQSTLTVDGVEVLVQRKRIKSFRLAVYPPLGQVRVSAPAQLGDAQLRMMIASRLDWIRAKQQMIAAHPAPAEPCYVSGEVHERFGHRYRLELIEGDAQPEVQWLNSGVVRMIVKPGASSRSKAVLLNRSYREELHNVIPALLARWQPVIGREVSFWGIKAMKTRWGSCNALRRRIWLNLELAKKPRPCLEYVLVHELVHLIEIRHNARFYALMDHFLPDWRSTRDVLNGGQNGSRA